MIRKCGKKIVLGIALGMICAAAGCGKQNVAYNDKDFSALKTPGSQEAAYEYKYFFIPEKDKLEQPYVGDTMPYYEDGTYYIYYLKEGGDSYNHSVYLTTTTDFLEYTEVDEPVLSASREGGQDAWIGTGSVVKVDNEYLFFYTGHAAGQSEYKETIMLAKGNSPYAFEKIPDWEIIPDASLKQKNDFRDPQAYIDEVTGDIVLTVTASQEGIARIIKYTVERDLSGYTYDGVIFTDPVGEVYNLECSDTFKMNDTYYLTYSAQDDTLWYAASKTPYGPYGEPKQLDNKLFYAAKHVSDGSKNYMAGWVRRSESPSSVYEVSGWAGNLALQQLIQLEDGSLCLQPVKNITDDFSVERKLLSKKDKVTIDAGSLYDYTEVFTAYESFKLTGSFSFKEKKGSFGLAFDFKKGEADYKLITISPKEEKIRLEFSNGDTCITEKDVTLQPDTEYTFTYIQEGSVGMFYIDGITGFTVRVYGVSGKPIRIFAGDSNVTFWNLKEFTR